VDKLHYAMDSLKRSMKWDEDRFGVSIVYNRGMVLLTIVYRCRWH